MQDNRKRELSPRQLAYRAYLQTHHWRELKKRKRAETPKECVFCKSGNSVQLHHMIYRSTFDETLLEDTCWLCRLCHQTFHRCASVKKKGSPEVLLAYTLRVLGDAKVWQKEDRLSKRERRRIRNQRKRDRKLAKIEAAEQREAARLEAKGVRTAHNAPKTATCQFNVAVRQVKPSSVLKGSAPSGVVTISAKEVEACITAREGYTRAQLAEWGVPWPPPKGWKKQLTDRV